MSWWTYVRLHAGALNQREIADRAAIDPSAISRWKRGGVPDAGSAVRFARAFGRPVLEALVVAEILSPDEAGTPPTQSQLDPSQMADDQLLTEVGRRMKAGSRDDARRAEAQKSHDDQAMTDQEQPKEDGSAGTTTQKMTEPSDRWATASEAMKYFHDSIHAAVEAGVSGDPEMIPPEHRQIFEVTELLYRMVKGEVNPDNVRDPSLSPFARDFENDPHMPGEITAPFLPEDRAEVARKKSEKRQRGDQKEVRSSPANGGGLEGVTAG